MGRIEKGELEAHVDRALAKLEGDEEAVEAVEMYWSDEHIMDWLAMVGAIVRRPSLAHPKWTAVELVDFHVADPRAHETAEAVASALAERLGVPLHSDATPEPLDGRRWLDDHPPPARSWTVQWTAQARHCVHADPHEPVELEGELVVTETTPAAALAAAKKHALAQLPQGEAWRHEAQVSLVVGEVTFTSGWVSPIRGADAPW